MGKKYEEIEKSLAVAVSALPIAGAVVRVFGSIALEGLREYSRYVDTQEVQAHVAACNASFDAETWATNPSLARITALCEKLTNGGEKP